MVYFYLGCSFLWHFISSAVNFWCFFPHWDQLSCCLLWIVLLSITNSMDMSLSVLRELVMNSEALCAGIHGVTKSRTRLSGWTELNWKMESTIKPCVSRPLSMKSISLSIYSIHLKWGHSYVFCIYRYMKWYIYIIYMNWRKYLNSECFCFLSVY